MKKLAHFETVDCNEICETLVPGRSEGLAANAKALSAKDRAFVGIVFSRSTAAVKAGLCGLLSLLLLGMSASVLAVTVSASPATCVSLGGGNQVWSNTNRAQLQDSSYVTATVNDGQVTDPLQCTGYGFAIPAGAAINGITVTVWRYASATSCCTDAQMQLVKAGTIQATDRSTTTYYPTSNTAEAHGSATDLWGTTWTVADINNTNFGAVFAAQKPVTSGGNRTVSVDYIQITIDYTPPPSVLSINTASTNPTAPATAVAWTVVFNTSVTNVTASNFALVQAGGVSGATITSVSGTGTTWTVNANTGSGAGTLGLNMINVAGISPAITTTMSFVGQTYTVPAPFCSPPSNIPAGVSVTCQCDTFNRATLSPSTIFGANWIVNTSGTTAYSPNIANSGYLRLTDTNGNEATSATVPGIFPAAGNYISVEFQQYAYNGSGADGLAVTLSDYSQTALPGAFGGSLGYAQKTGINGFNGGWVGIALDEYGNFENSSEGRSGGLSASTLYKQSVGVRGSGVGTTGYPWLAGATALSPGIANSGSATRAYGFFYQVIVDARNASNPTPQTFVSVNRDTTGGSTAYSALVAPVDVFAVNPSQAAVPNNWQISFTGSTGGATDVHEIGSLRICAQNIVPPSGGTAGDFNVIDEAYGTPPSVSALNYVSGRIYMKLQGIPFKLNVAVMSSNNQILTTYAQTSAKTVTVKLVNNSDNVCILDSTQPGYCSSTCTSKPAVTGGSQSLIFATAAADKGQKQSTSFTINSAYQKLVAIISDGTLTACSTDSFSVRPLSITSVSSSATNTSTTGAPIFKAGSDNFSLIATTSGVAGNANGYNGVLKINNAGVQFASPATVVGTLAGTFPAAVSGTPSSIATGSAFTYSEVGAFYLRAPDFTVPRIPGIYDDTWTAIDSDPLKNDCIVGTAATAYSNTKDANGKYGCYFGIASDTPIFGRFVPDHFDTVVTGGMPCPNGLTCPLLFNGFVYSGQTFTTNVIARNLAGVTTLNYDSTIGLSKIVTLGAWDAKGSIITQNPPAATNGTLSSNTVLAAAFKNGTTSTLYTLPNAYPSVTAPPGPTDIYMRAVDTDGVTSLQTIPANSIEGGIKIVSGRIKVSNAYGSELLPLTMTATAQYYGTNGWITSATDNLSSLVLPATYAVGSGTSTVTLNPASGKLSSGVLSISLGKPGSAGIATVTPTVPVYLPVISGTATFGVYSGSNRIIRFIYQRESY
jgi:MSHA biogenesis protein MshQ